jgi:hypothetical protein
MSYSRVSREVCASHGKARWLGTREIPVDPGFTGETGEDPSLTESEMEAMLLPDVFLAPDLEGEEIHKVIRSFWIQGGQDRKGCGTNLEKGQ